PTRSSSSRAGTSEAGSFPPPRVGIAPSALEGDDIDRERTRLRRTSAECATSRPQAAQGGQARAWAAPTPGGRRRGRREPLASMVVRASRRFLPTLRDAPADAEAVSHKLLVRGGFIRQVSAGLWTFTPLGWRIHRKVEQIVREEMDAIGAQ